MFCTNEFAAIIVEPLIQGSAGMRMYSPEFLNKLVVLARSYGVLVIFDEVMTGWGRTGRLFAMDYVQDKPDIVCLSKGLTGGVLPLGLTVATQVIFESFLSEEKTKALLHGHSFTWNALACAVACANIELIKEPDFKENIDRIKEQHELFKSKLEYNSKLSEIRCLGTIIAIEIKDTNADYFSSLRDEAYTYFLSIGLLIRPLGNVIFLNPPYCTTNQELEKMYKGIGDFIEGLH